MSERITNRAQLVAWCDARGISLSFENWTSTKHIHANIDAPRMKFRATDTHNLGLGNWERGERIDWRDVGQQLVDADFGPCDDAECEYCRQEDL